jgi:hypothetical protein
VVSNLLVTIGLTGLFYAGWTLAGGLRLRRALVWLGMESYGIYLLHQPPLLWASELLSERPWILLVAALLLLVASLPAAWLLRRLVEWIEGRIAAQPSPGLGSTVDVGAVAVGVVCILLQPAVGTTRPGRALALVMGLAAVALAARELTEVRRGGCRVLRVSVLTALALALFVLPSGASLLILGLAAGLLDAAARALAGERLPARLAAACAFGVLLLGGELALHRWAPLEAGRWGEFPALETHPTRVYALRPSATTRLHYNNYDYVLRTNSLGLPGPEVSPSRSTPETLRVLVIGDAFTMPEGLQVEDSYPALLQARLSECLAPRPVQVINAGVTGYGPAEEVPQLKELTPLLRPDVVIWEFFVNEFSEVLLTPEERHFDIGFPVEGRRTSFRGRLQIGARARWLQDRAAELLTGRSGQRRYAKALLDHYESGPSRVYTERSEAAIRAALAGARRAADGVGAQLLVFYVPGAIAVSRPQDIAYYPWSEPLGDRRRYDLERPLKVLTRLAAPLGIPVVDLTPELRSGTKRPVYFPESWHWNREGHVVAATVMLRTLSQRGILGTSQGEGPACGD